jgi:hypothetical protein
MDSDEAKDAGGPDGWSAHQGFFIYRNLRLIVPGGWLGLGKGRAWTSEEAYRLVRISIDIDNSVDFDWKIDIKKSVARPPIPIRDRLIVLAEDCRARARKVFFRQQKSSCTHVTEDSVCSVWDTYSTSNGFKYRISTDHPAIRAVLAIAGPDSRAVIDMLRIIEETVPVRQIWMNTSENHAKIAEPMSDLSPSSIREIAKRLLDQFMIRDGKTLDEAKSLLLCVEPFQYMKDFILQL